MSTRDEGIALTEAATRYINETASDAFRARFRFACMVFEDVKACAAFLFFSAPAGIEAEHAREVDDVLGEVAEIVDGMLNPPGTASEPRAFVLTIFDRADRSIGRGVTNAADEAALYARLAELRAATRRRTLQ